MGTLLQALHDEYLMRGRKSLDTARYHWEPVDTFMGHMAASEVTVDTLRAYVLYRQGKGKANATINRELAGLKTAMKLADLQWPRFPMLKETGIRQGTYTREEVEKLAMALPEHVRPVLWFGYYTGRRRGEILQIRWEDVDWSNEWITIRNTTTKTGQPDRIPLVGSLRLLVTALAQQGPHSRYLFTYNGRPFRTFSSAWKRALRITKLPNKLFHDLRRTAVTDMEEAGVPRGTAMAITGHKTFSVYQRYNIVRQESIREGLSVLQKHREGK